MGWNYGTRFDMEGLVENKRMTRTQKIELLRRGRGSRSAKIVAADDLGRKIKEEDIRRTAKDIFKHYIVPSIVVIIARILSPVAVIWTLISRALRIKPVHPSKISTRREFVDYIGMDFIKSYFAMWVVSAEISAAMRSTHAIATSDSAFFKAVGGNDQLIDGGHIRSCNVF